MPSHVALPWYVNMARITRGQPLEHRMWPFAGRMTQFDMEVKAIAAVVDMLRLRYVHSPLFSEIYLIIPNDSAALAIMNPRRSQKNTPSPR
jgi:hypothetical protein